MPVYQQPFHYRVYLDLDRDGSFETGEEITDYVMNVSLIRGMSGMRLVADVGKCVITLRNDDKRFTLSNTGSPYYNQLKTNVPVRVDVVDDTETYTIFRGVIYTIALQPGEKGTARLGRAVIECVDLMGILQAHRISLPLQSSKTPQYLINLITSAAFRSAYATNNITFSANPADGNYVEIGDGTRYTFKTSIAAANDVLIGSTVEDTVDNLVAAVNGNEGSGTKYYANTTRPTGVTAAPRMTYYREVQKSRPTRYYRLGESAGTNADDVGENGRDGTYVNTPTLGATGALSGDSDTAVTFDPSATEYVDIPVFSITNTSFTFECWVNASASSPPASQVPISFAGAETTRFIVYSNGDLLFAVKNLESVDAVGVFTFGAWHHMVVTYNAASDTSYIYLDGEEVGSGSAGPVTETKTTAYIGTEFPGFTHWKGEIDEVALYMRALSATEVATHYAAASTTRGVNLSANARGSWGNSLTLAKSGANISIGGATFSGGVDGPTSLTSYDTGISTIDTAADRWNAGETNALDAIEDVVETERGLFWCASDGTLTFKGRDFIFKQASTAVSLTLDSEHTDAEIVYDNEEVFNRIIVSSRPRSRLVSGVVAKATGVIQVPGTWGQDRNNPADDMPEGGSTVVRLPYVEQDSYKLSGAESLTLPLVASTDFQIYDTEDTSGFNYTNNGHVKFTVAINGSEIEVSLRNTALGPLYVQNLQVRGVGIIAYEPQETVVDDGDSQDTYGRRSLTIDLPLPVANYYNFARALAEYTLSRYKDPMLRARSIGFGNSRKRVGGDAYGNGGTKLYALDIGDVISLTDDQTGITAQKYMITSVRLRLEAGNFKTSNIEFGLRRLDEVSYWLLEDATYGVLDSTTRLAL